MDIHQGFDPRALQLFSQFRQARLALWLWLGTFGLLLLPALVRSVAPSLLPAVELEPWLGGAEGALGFGAAFLIPLMLTGFVLHPRLSFRAHLTRTFALLRGQVLRSLAVSLAGVGLIGVGLLACGFGVLPAIAFQQLLVTGLVLALENDPAFTVKERLGGEGR